MEGEEAENALAGEETQAEPMANTYAGCSAGRQRRVERARLNARYAANRAANAFTALRAGTASVQQGRARTAHFGALTDTEMGTVETRFTGMKTRLDDPALIECGAPPAQAFCGPPDSWCAGTNCPQATAISYLCSAAFSGSCAEPNLWSIVLHEAGRAMGCCEPDVQPGEAGYPPAAPDCLTNIYSYTGFTRSI